MLLILRCYCEGCKILKRKGETPEKKNGNAEKRAEGRDALRRKKSNVDKK